MQEKETQTPDFELLLKRFKQECIRDGLFSEIKKRRYFMPPSEKKKQKALGKKKIK